MEAGVCFYRERINLRLKNYISQKILLLPFVGFSGGSPAQYIPNKNDYNLLK
jgi:hypothetical protein